MDVAADQRPTETPPRPAAFGFGGFVLDPTRGILRGQDGAELPLRPKSFDVLRHLAERAGHLGPRDELMTAVWRDVFVTDDNITQCVVEIRHVLGAEGPRLLRTMPRRGYMLAAEVTRVEPPPLRAVPASSVACAPDAPEPGAEPDDQAPRHHPGRPVLAAGAGAAALAAGAAGWWRLLWWPPSAPTPLAPAEPAVAVPPPTQAGRTPTADEALASRRMSLVVLPFANQGREAEQDGVADAITDTLTTVLGRDSLFFVIGRGTARTYKDVAVDVRQVGRELGVRYALQGTVRRRGDQNAIAVQLLDTATRGQLWVEQFDLPHAGPPELARLATGRIHLPAFHAVVAAEDARSLTERPDDPDAQDLLLRGVAFFNRSFTRETQREARRLFERAVALDEGSANAQAFLGAVKILGAEVTWGPGRDADLQAGERHVERAVAIDGRNIWAHFWRGFAHSLRWRFDEAIVEYDMVIALNPSHAWAYGKRGVIRLHMGRPDEAVADLGEAVRISPRDWGMGHWSANLGLAYLMLGRDEDALPHYMRAVAMEPSSASRVLYLAAGYALLGRTDEARSVLQGLREQRPDITILYLRPTDMRFSPNPLWRWTRDRQLAGLRLAGLPED